MVKACRAPLEQVAAVPGGRYHGATSHREGRLDTGARIPLTWDWAGDTRLTGQTLGGRYRIERRVGQGGTAHVYLAHDTETDAQVAIKVMLPELITEPSLVERLRREAAIAMRLDHPNVCPIIAVGETDEGHAYLVMPFLPGEELAIR